MLKLLLVEDNDGIAEILTYQLERSGFEVIVATTLEEAHDYLNDAELVILDWVLPDGEGVSLLKHIQAKPVIMLTARAREEDKQQALAAGASSFLTKPFAFNDLLKYIAQFN